MILDNKYLNELHRRVAKFMLREDFIEDLRKIEKEEGIKFESKEELGTYLENL